MLLKILMQRHKIAARQN